MKMKIALIGAPGSEKSETARLVAEKLGRTKIIDDYIEEIEQESTFALGRSATYIGNLYALLGRYARERKAWECESCFDYTITCGTLIETAVYTSLQAVRNQTEPQWVRIQNMMNIMGSFFQDTWRYRATFVLEAQDLEDGSFEWQVDKHLLMAIDSFGIPYGKVEGTPEEKAAKIIEALEEAQKTDAEAEAASSK